MSHLNKGGTDLEHYAESLRTRERDQAREVHIKLWQAFAVAVLGAALALLGQWIAHRLGIGG